MWPVLVNSSEPVQQEKPDVHDEVKPASFVKPVIPPTLRFETEQTSRPVQEKPLEKPKVSLKPMVKSNPAGESTQKMAIWYAGKNEVQRIYVFVFWGAMAVSIVLMLIYPSSILGLFVFALAMYGIIDFLLKKEKRSRKLTKNFAKGAKGEMVVGQILAELGDEFAVWHDVPGRYGNFDHVVLSKSGQLFAIETKAHSGKVRIVGERILVNNYEPEKNMIGQCTSNWVSLRETVQMVTGKTVYVTPLLVFTNAFVVPGKPVKGIYIVNKKYLKQTILNNCRNKVDRFHLWDDLTILNKIFSQKNLTYKEFSRNDFESISSWGKQSF
jgi:Nuclease-related domain.